ncbi:MAG: hypothetical protein K2R98_18240 [Gemmataceae bacterium]|nr:hypothetical protein [Gemmataceae bacterium]
MPYCEYRCDECGERFDVMMSYDEDEPQPDERCPRCDSQEVDRVPIDLATTMLRPLQER